MSEVLPRQTFDPAVLRQRFVLMFSADRRADAEQRFDRAGLAPAERLAVLYGQTSGFVEWIISLYEDLGRLAAARSDALVALDERRARQPDWFLHQHMVGYSAYVDRFGGTLAGVGNRIDHLRALGVDYLHLLPFLQARQGESDGGFAVSSFDHVEPALGTMHDLEALASQLHDAGISLCADLVLNHVADDHAWAREAAAGDPAMRAFFHVFSDRHLPDAYEETVGEVFPQAAPGNFTHVPAMCGWVWTTFYPFQWDLNYAHPPVFAAIARALLQLANRGVNVFRLDSAPFLWKRLGTACINEPEVHQLLAALRACTELVAPGVLLKAEAIVPTEQVSAYFGRDELRGKECQLAYHSGLMASAWAALAEGHAGLPRQLLATTPALPDACGWITYVRCHDDIVWGVLRQQIESGGENFAQRMAPVTAFLEGRTTGSFAHGAAFQAQDANAVHGSNGMAAALVGLPEHARAVPQAAALRRYVLMHALALWVGAVPLIYMGDELGQYNNDDPADAGRIAADGRWLQRPVFSTDALAALAEGEGVPAATFTALTELIAARRQLSSLAGADIAVVAWADPRLLILRRGEDALAVFNFSAAETIVDLASLGAGDGWMDGFARGADPATTAISTSMHGRTLQPWATLWRRRAHD